MIGQSNLLNNIDKIKNRFPRFSIIVGAEKSGKQTLCKEISKLLNTEIFVSGIKIDEIRETIELSYNQSSPLIILFPNADNMSLGAKNSLLKITEEPPKNVYFILTLTSIDNTLPTIKSRGTVFNLDNYTKEELLEYRKYRGYNQSNDDIISKICETTGDVDEIFSYNISEFYNFANYIAIHIHIPTSGNLFKITKFMKIKESDNGYNTILLLKTIQNLYKDLYKETKKSQYLNAILTTSKSISELKLNSVSKLGTMDNWIMNVRRSLVGI